MQNAKKMKNAEEDKLRQRLKKMFQNVNPSSSAGSEKQKPAKKQNSSFKIQEPIKGAGDKGSTLNAQKRKVEAQPKHAPPSTTNGKVKLSENVQEKSSPPTKKNKQPKKQLQQQATENVAANNIKASKKPQHKKQTTTPTLPKTLLQTNGAGGKVKDDLGNKSNKNQNQQNKSNAKQNLEKQKANKNKAKKRAADEDTTFETPSKPQKKKPKKQPKSDESKANNEASDQHLIDFLPGAMQGFVPGGDYDELEEENNEWAINELNSDSEEAMYEEEEEEEEEDYENYSDFDEDDYEEESDDIDNDFYYDDDDKSSDDEEEGDFFESDIDYFEGGSNDHDYELPEEVPEDLIIHRGTAEKRALESHDNVQFDSENEEAQVVELQLEQQTILKSIQQPKAYEKEELLKLSIHETYLKTELLAAQKPVPLKVTPTQNVDKVEDDVVNSDTDTCPQLVPIVDEDGFQLYDPAMDYSDIDEEEEDENEEYDFDEEGSIEEIDDGDSLGSSYEECSDVDSLNSIDINRKWLNSAAGDLDSSDDESVARKASQMKADIISAENCIYESKKSKTKSIKSNESEQSETLPMQKLINNVTSESSVVVAAALLETDELEDDLERDISNEYIKENELTKIIEQNKSSVNDSPTQEPKSNSTRLENLRAINPFAGETKHESIASSTLIARSRSICCNAIDSNHVLVLLKDPFYIYGTVKLVLIAGSVEVYGHAPLIGDELEIFSPRGCSAIQITTTPNTKIDRKHIAAEMERLETYFSRGELERIQKAYEPASDALLILKRNVARKKIVANFKKYMNENVFPNINALQGGAAERRPFYSSEFLLRCMLNTEESDKVLLIPPQWSTLKLETHSRILLAGGKAVGKSTLLRYLVNRHLPQRILLIDLDIGQPELFVPQTVSCTLVDRPLLGPGFFLQRQPERAYVVGHTNLALCAHTYLRAVKQLLGYCHAHTEYAQLPWLVNTMGYNKGFGMELMTLISQLLRPTDIVQLQSNKEINNFDALLRPQELLAVQRNIYATEEFKFKADDNYTPQHRLHVLQSAVPQESRFQREWDMSAKDMRYAMLLARLSDALQGHAEWLTDCKPLSAPLDSLKIVNLLSADNTREELLKSIEANLVYLCRLSTDAAVDSKTPLECFGIGVVRGIDYHIQQIYLLPAMPHRLMRNVNCLAMGEMPLPTSMFTNQGPKVKQVAPFVYNTVAAKASKSIKQIYHRPPEFLTGKHKDLA